VFATKELLRLCNDERSAIRSWGKPRWKLVSRRLDQMLAAPDLASFMKTPGFPHPLRADRSGQFTVDLDGPYRLVFEPADDPLPTLESTNQLELQRVRTVRLLGVEDTHE
jgi:proteic killer suppression protein